MYGPGKMTVKIKPIGAHLILAVCSTMDGRIVRNYRKRMSHWDDEADIKYYGCLVTPSTS